MGAFLGIIACMLITIKENKVSAKDVEVNNHQTEGSIPSLLEFLEGTSSAINLYGGNNKEIAEVEKEKEEKPKEIIEELQ